MRTGHWTIQVTRFPTSELRQVAIYLPSFETRTRWFIICFKWSSRRQKEDVFLNNSVREPTKIHHLSDSSKNISITICKTNKDSTSLLHFKMVLWDWPRIKITIMGIVNNIHLWPILLMCHLDRMSITLVKSCRVKLNRFIKVVLFLGRKSMDQLFCLQGISITKSKAISIDR